MRDPENDGNVLYHYCVNVNIWIIILYHSSARCYHWGELSMGYMGPLCIDSYNYMSIYNCLKIKKLIENTYHCCCITLPLVR